MFSQPVMFAAGNNVKVLWLCRYAANMQHGGVLGTLVSVAKLRKKWFMPKALIVKKSIAGLLPIVDALAHGRFHPLLKLRAPTCRHVLCPCPVIVYAGWRVAKYLGYA